MRVNIEFIIGTIIGVIGIIPVLISIAHGMQKTNLSQLMDKLVCKELSQKERLQVLRSMNRKLLFSGHRLKDEYINNFSLGKKGKEAVFEELCLQNHIEPIREMCCRFMKNDYPSIRKRYYRQVNSSSVASTAIPSPLRNGVSAPVVKRQIVYMSELLRERYPATCLKLTGILDKHAIPFRLLKATKDIWCRDYLPVQTASGRLVQFRYEPSYLKGEEWRSSRSDVKEVCRANGFQPIFSNINLDGGNVLLCEGRAIISDRVFTENPEYSDKQQLISEIERLLEAEVIIIPTQKEDMTGHADGMVRFVNRTTVLGNNRADEYKYWTDGINKVLQHYHLGYEDVPFFWGYKSPGHPNHAIGIYVNYLEIGKLVVLPVFEVPGNKDAEALERFRQIFPDRIIETINYNEIGLEGGLLNCTTWIMNE